MEIRSLAIYMNDNLQNNVRVIYKIKIQELSISSQLGGQVFLHLLVDNVSANYTILTIIRAISADYDSCNLSEIAGKESP